MAKHDVESLAGRFGNRFIVEEVPDKALSQAGMSAEDALRLVQDEVVLDGDPERNLATFVTTRMEPEARELIAANLHRNFIDHAEYPQTALIEQRCIRILAELFNATEKTTGARCQGSSEAIMLGALALKWNWRKRREAAGKSTERPNLVFGNDVHVVWEKFCRYFDVEPRIVPLQEEKYTIGPEDVQSKIDENTIGVAAVLGTTFTGHADDIRGINKLLIELRNEKGLDVPLHIDAASGGFVWPFLYPDYEWDFRLEQVRSINVSGHKFGLVYPGIGWLVFRDEAQLPNDLIFTENYLGRTDPTFTLNFSTGAAMVLAQYYNFVRLGRDGYGYAMRMMQRNTEALAKQIEEIGPFKLVTSAEPERLSYEDFIQKVQDGQVKSTSLGPLNFLEGTYVLGDVEKKFFTQHPRDSWDDPLLNKLLETHKVSVVRKELPQAGAMELLAQNAPVLLLLVVPSVLLVFVIIYVLRINKKIDQVIIH